MRQKKALWGGWLWLILGLGFLAVGCGGESTPAVGLPPEEGGAEAGAAGTGVPDAQGHVVDANANSTTDAAMTGTGADGAMTGADAAMTGTAVDASGATKDATATEGADATTTSKVDGKAGTTLDATTMDAVAVADAAGCSQASCPMGCCDTSGQCQAGTTPTECGLMGAACQDCLAAGFEGCNTQVHSCFSAMAACGPANCAGCCVDGTCFPGNLPTDCGSGGQACQQCGAQLCAAQQCVAAACGPANCSGCCMGTQCIPGEGGGASCDGGTAPCDGTTCPNGCCDGNGVCQLGTSNTTCGNGGDFCDNCSTMFGGFGGGSGGRGGGPIPFGGPFVCINQGCTLPPPCACSTGCCDATGACQPGASNSACGQSFSSCQDCTQSATQCSNQQCGAALDAGVCNAQTCPTGCCDVYGECQQGIASTVCGGGGTNCQNCIQSNEACSNQQCVTPADAGQSCGADSCGGCCDALGNCTTGGSDTQCGNGGRPCLNCAGLGGTCSATGFPFEFQPPGTCELPDGAVPCSQACAGCCDATGTCQLGFTNAQCGEQGATCIDCTTGTPPSTCDVTVSPRTCTSLQSQCPAPYPSCPAALTEQAPARQKVCSAAELQNAAAACTGGATTTACTDFMNVEENSNLSCYNCLEEFDYDFVTQVGVRLCLAPFVDAACNHNSACIADCVTQSCYPCPDPGSTTQCDTQAQTTTCSTYFQGDQCVTTALAGAGALCSSATYQGNFGLWLQAVGAQYCGM
jgi:hypothetical protein